MFSVKGWTSVYDIHRTVADKFPSVPEQLQHEFNLRSRNFREEIERAAGKQFDKTIPTPIERDSKVPFELRFHEEGGVIPTWQYLATWDICQSIDRVCVLSQYGTPVQVSKAILDCFDPQKHRGTHVDLYLGTVGSSPIQDPDTSGVWENETDRKTRYGPFLYCPVIVPTQSFKRAFRLTEGRLFSAAPNGSLVQMILDRHRADPTLTKPKIYKLIDPRKELSTIEWEATWKEAVALQPSPSTPGPRGKRR